jgi:hypothetical protein
MEAFRQMKSFLPRQLQQDQMCSLPQIIEWQCVNKCTRNIGNKCIQGKAHSSIPGTRIARF